METYVCLMNFTEQGIKNIKEAPARIDALGPTIEAAGGKLLGWYLTQGRYDAVVITQGSDDKAMMSRLLATGAQGNVRTETMRAFTAAEFKDIVAKMP